MATPLNDEGLRFPPRARPILCLAFVAQAALLASLLAWTSAAQQPVAASAPAAPRAVGTLPRAVSSLGAAELDGWIYVFGGHAGRTHSYSAATQSDAFARVRADDPAVREELPGGERMQSTLLVAAGGRILRIGGMRAAEGTAGGGEAHLASLATVRAFDPATKAWSDLPALPEPRSSHDGAAVGQRVFVFGGWNLDGDSDDARWHEQGLVLDLAEGANAAWRPIEQPFVQRGIAVAASASEVFVLGGMDAEGEFSSRVAVLDAASGMWSEAPEFPEPGFGLAAAVAGTRLFATGRSGGVWELARDDAGGEARWLERGELLVPRLFHRMVASGGALTVLGGSSDSRPVAWIERLAPLDRPATALLSIPFEGRARQRQALFAHESVLHLFGGNVALEQHAFEPEDFLAESWRVELGSASATALPALPTPRQSMVCVAAPGNEAVYALGGFGHDGAKDRAFDEVWRCELASGEWRALEARLPRPMTQFRALAHGDELLIVGGMDFDREREQKMRLLDEVFVADAKELEKGFADSGLRLPSKRRAFGATLVDEVLYLAGGLDESFEAVATFDAYDFRAKEWRALPAPRTARLSPELIALGGKLYLVAGLVFDEKGSALPAEKIEEYDPARGTWRELPLELPIDPHEVQAFAWNERLALVSTWNERGVLELALVDPAAMPDAP